MMKLILSLTLIWTLSSTAEALQCVNDDGVNPKKLQKCEMCATFANREISNGKIKDTITRLCVLPFLFNVGTRTSSFNFGFHAKYEYAHVCNTDQCNIEAIPYPGDQKNNGKFCYTCNDETSTRCKTPIMCLGEQTRCIRAIVEEPQGTRANYVGCISPTKCQDLKLLANVPGNFTRPECCEGSLCNSAWSVKLNVITLLFAPITLIFSLF